jgi:hypothetical protein
MRGLVSDASVKPFDHACRGARGQQSSIWVPLHCDLQIEEIEEFV